VHLRRRRPVAQAQTQVAQAWTHRRAASVMLEARRDASSRLACVAAAWRTCTPVLTRTSRGLRTVCAGYAYQPPAAGTVRASLLRTVRT